MEAWRLVSAMELEEGDTAELREKALERVGE